MDFHINVWCRAVRVRKIKMIWGEVSKYGAEYLF